MDVEPAGSREIEALVQEIYSLPDNVIAKTRQIVTGSVPPK
jgi:hypothetical protein